MNVQDLIKKLKQFPVATIAAAVALALLVVMFFRFGTVSELEAEVESLEERLGRMNRNLANATGLDDHIALLESINQRIDKGIIDPNTKASNLDYFYSLEGATGVRVLSVSQRDVPVETDGKKPAIPVGTPKTELYQPLNFDISISGGFPQVVRYLDLIGRDRYFVRITSLTLSETDALTRSLSASIQISVLATKPPSEAKPPARGRS